MIIIELSIMTFNYRFLFWNTFIFKFLLDFSVVTL
jgi:hypothetical protein